jgi:hypothetical protein
MPPDPPDSDDPFEKYDRKRAEDAKKASEQPQTPPDEGGNGADPPKNGPDIPQTPPDNVVPISQGRRSNTKPKKDPPDVRGIVEATSELSLQQKFSETHAHSLKFVGTDAQWYYWTGEQWRYDDVGHIHELLKVFQWDQARLHSG